jgi:hypothetical protein
MPRVAFPMNREAGGEVLHSQLYIFTPRLKLCTSELAGCSVDTEHSNSALSHLPAELENQVECGRGGSRKALIRIFSGQCLFLLLLLHHPFRLIGPRDVQSLFVAL